MKTDLPTYKSLKGLTLLSAILLAAPFTASLASATPVAMTPLAQMTETPAQNTVEDRDDGFPWGLLGLLGLIGLAGLRKRNEGRTTLSDGPAARGDPPVHTRPDRPSDPVPDRTRGGDVDRPVTSNPNRPRT